MKQILSKHRLATAGLLIVIIILMCCAIGIIGGIWSASNHATLSIASLGLIFVLSLSLLVLGSRATRYYQRHLAQMQQREWERMDLVAHTDLLTSLPNHRAAIEHLETTLAACQHSQEPCAIVLVDLDHFKQVNDRWGHRVGDALLRETGHRLRQQLRSEDLVGRYGGEEFLIVLPRANQEQAQALAERVRATIADQPCILAAEEETAEPYKVAVTASLGIAVSPESEITAVTLLATADSALHQAKYSGRNQVCIASKVYL